MKSIGHIGRSFLRSALILILTAVMAGHAVAQTNAQPSGLVGWWPGDGDTADLSGHNLPGTLHDNATFGPGQVGQAFVFDGDGDWVDLGDQTGDFGTADFSLALWVRFDTLDGEQVLVEDYVEPPGVGWSLSKHADNRLFFGWDTGQQVNIPSGLVTALQWHHVAVTRAGTTFTIYLDGIARDMQTQSPSLASAAHLKLGMRGEPAETPGHFFLHGAIDDVQVYNRALSGTEIQTIVGLNQPPDCSAAAPSINIIWPPNHQFVPINVLGVTDPEGDPITIEITSIRQDEPVDTFGDGRFTPDGQGVGTSTAEIRAERAATGRVPGNGRVYHIGFTASDGMGSSCEGEILVGVPANQGRGSTPVDDGPHYDSTATSP
jgi:hypothetical protein